jgi:hypothetical protein
MEKLKAVLLWPVRTIGRLRALVKDQDHDDWLDTHREQEHKKRPDFDRIIHRGGRIIRNGPTLGG